MKPIRFSKGSTIYYFIGNLFHILRKTCKFLSGTASGGFRPFFQLKPATAVPSVMSLSIERISK